MSELESVRVTRLYVWLLGAGLLLDGGLLLVLNALGDTRLPINTTDTEHNLLHVAWGIALLVVSVVARHGHELRAVWACVIFGVFYVALGIAGLTFSDPFGLQLGPGENAFHLTVGPLALGLGAWALRSVASKPVPLRTAAQPVEVRNVPAARRRARHRPGKARVRARRH
jgi:hypothetical protein